MKKSFRRMAVAVLAAVLLCSPSAPAALATQSVAPPPFQVVPVAPALPPQAPSAPAPPAPVLPEAARPRTNEGSFGGERVQQMCVLAPIAVRAEPGSGESVAALRANDVLVLIGAPSNGWQKVLVGDKVAYISAGDLATKLSPGITVKPSHKIAKLAVNATIYTNASGKGAKVATARAGTNIVIIPFGMRSQYALVIFARNGAMKKGFIPLSALAQSAVALQ